MKELHYIAAKIKSKLSDDPKESLNNYFRKSGMMIGNGCNICCNIMTPEPYLIEIGNDTTIAGYVHFITHDNSISKVLKDKTDFFGKVSIGNNCFIGQGSLVLPGVQLGNNIIVAAGSVVTRSFNEEHIIIGGNPARKIGDWEHLKSKGISQAVNTNGLTPQEKRQLLSIPKNLIIKKEGWNEE